MENYESPESPILMASDVEDEGEKDVGKLINHETPESPAVLESDVEEEEEKDVGKLINDESPESSVAIASDVEEEEGKKKSEPEQEHLQRAKIEDDESPESPAPMTFEEDAMTPPERVESDDEEYVKPKTHHRIQMSDDEDEQEKDDHETPESSAALASDVEDEGEKDVGKLINNIFGDESDGEGEGQPNEGEEGTQVKRTSDQEEEEEKEWDFDRIIAEKKKERGTKRRRRRDGSIDLCQNADGQIRHVVELMKSAAAIDREANHQRRPAIKKTQMIDVVKSLLMRSDFFEALLENDMMAAISEWLAPLPDKSLPALEIRSTLLKILEGFPALEPGILKCSGLGKAVMLIHKHPKETKENKVLAAHLIRKWSQPIFQINADFANITREERERLDLDLLPEVKRRKIEEKYMRGGSSSQKQTKESAVTLGPGDKGYINRARVPKRSTSAYIIRPKPNVDGPFRGSSKNHANSRFDKATREFKERSKGLKAQRAVGVSIEGRKMEI